MLISIGQFGRDDTLILLGISFTGHEVVAAVEQYQGEAPKPFAMSLTDMATRAFIRVRQDNAKVQQITGDLVGTS